MQSHFSEARVVVHNTVVPETPTVLMPGAQTGLLVIGRGAGRVLAWSGDAPLLLEGVEAGRRATDLVDWSRLSPLEAPPPESQPLPTWREVEGRGGWLDATLSPAAECLFLLLERPADGAGSALADAVALGWETTRAQRRAATLADLADVTAQAVIRISGYDRVRVLRLLPPQHVGVVADVLRPGAGLDSHERLPFAPWLFPRQARMLYVPDLALPPAPLRPGLPALHQKPFDLGASTLPSRVVADGVSSVQGGVLAVSLHMGDRLWGVLMAESADSRPVPAAVRQVVGQVAEGFSAHLTPCLAPSASPLRDGDDRSELRGCLGRQLEKERRVLAQYQRRHDDDLSRLSGGLAHALNNLLQPIQGYSELALMISEGESEICDFLQEILLATTQAGHLVKALQRYARQDPPPLRPLVLGPALHAALDGLETMIPDLRLVRAIDDDKSEVLADSGDLAEVVRQLVLNAWQAQGQTGSVSVSLAGQKSLATPARCPGEISGALELVVQDQGRGMTPDVAASASLPFFSTHPTGEAVGLGLAIVRAIVQSWCGCVLVETSPGQGTIVRIQWPIVSEQWNESVHQCCDPVSRMQCQAQAFCCNGMPG